VTGSLCGMSLLGYGCWLCAIVSVAMQPVQGMGAR